MPSYNYPYNSLFQTVEKVFRFELLSMTFVLRLTLIFNQNISKNVTWLVVKYKQTSQTAKRYNIGWVCLCLCLCDPSGCCRHSHKVNRTLHHRQPSGIIKDGSASASASAILPCAVDIHTKLIEPCRTIVECRV